MHGKHGQKIQTERMEQRAKHLAALKTKLNLTAQQEAAWNAFSTSRKGPMHTMGGRQARQAEFAKLTTPQIWTKCWKCPTNVASTWLNAPRRSRLFMRNSRLRSKPCLMLKRSSRVMAAAVITKNPEPSRCNLKNAGGFRSRFFSSVVSPRHLISPVAAPTRGGLRPNCTLMERFARRIASASF